VDIRPRLDAGRDRTALAERLPAKIGSSLDAFETLDPGSEKRNCSLF
jgi:hypothetical protein